MFSNIFQGIVASSGIISTFCPEYQNVLNYATLQGYTLPSLAQQSIQNDLMKYVTGSGLYNELDIFYVFCNNGSQEYSLINWINTGSYYGQISGSTLPTWGQTTGWKGDGTSAYISTQYLTTLTSPQKFLLQDASTFIYTTPDSPNIAPLVGYEGAGAGTTIIRINQNNNTSQRMMTNLATVGNINFTGEGLKHINSIGVNTQKYIKDGVLLSTQTIANFTPRSTIPISILRSQNNYGNSYVKIFGLGGDTTNYSSSLNDNITTYLSSI